MQECFFARQNSLPIKDPTNGMVEWERTKKEENNHAEASMDRRTEDANRPRGAFT
jgi:hypothetical protein